MKIRRFLAENVSAAMAQVRTELGPDAVILSNQQRDGQVEIVCAVDYDEARLASAADDSALADADRSGNEWLGSGMAQSRAVANSLSADRYLDPPIQQQASAARSPKAGVTDERQVIWASDPLMEDMHHTVESLRDLIEHQMLDMVWAGSASHQPNTSLAVRKLLEAGFSAETSRGLLADIPPGYNRERALNLALTLLRRKLPAPQNSLLESGGRVAIVGPPGAGKTTLAVGLAAQYARQHGVSEVALVGLDNQRVGAQEQLRLYGQLLGMPVHILQTPAALKATIQALEKKSLVVVDTAGYSGNDAALQPQLRQLMALASEGLETLLVLPAHGSSAFLQAAVRRYRISIPQGCAVTHLDSVSQPGIVLSCLLENQLRAELMAQGPRIADDIELFDSNQILARFKPQKTTPPQPLETPTKKEASHAG